MSTVTAIDQRTTSQLLEDFFRLTARRSRMSKATIDWCRTTTSIEQTVIGLQENARHGDRRARELLDGPLIVSRHR